jgi:polar amino acid transport system substrate-binding protein
VFNVEAFMKQFIVAVFAFIMLCSGFAVYADDHQRNCTRLQASGNAEYPPYLWRSAKDPSRLTGAIAYMVEDLASELKLEVDLIYRGPWGRVQVDMSSGFLDILAGAFYTVPRTKYMDYIYPAFQGTRTAVLVNKDKPIEFAQWIDLKDFSGITVIHNSFGQAFDQFAKENLAITEVASLDQGLGMLSAARIDYLLYEESPALANVTKMGIKNITALPVEVTHQDLFLTVSKSSPCHSEQLKTDLATVIDKFSKEKRMLVYLSKAQAQWAKEQGK